MNPMPVHLPSRNPDHDELFRAISADRLLDGDDGFEDFDEPVLDDDFDFDFDA